MSTTVKIPVPAGLVTHQGVVQEVVLSEPTLDLYLELGDPVTLARAPDGSLFTVENNVVIRAYIERCLVVPAQFDLLSPGGLRLARALRSAVLGFFRAESSEDAPSKTSATISSSQPEKADSTPAPSAA